MAVYGHSGAWLTRMQIHQSIFQSLESELTVAFLEVPLLVWSNR